MAAVDVELLSCYFQAVIRGLSSRILKEFQSQPQYGADQDLKVLGTNLRKIKTVFNDADQRQREDEEVKEWFVNVRDLVYDAEDILDLYATEVGRWNQQVRNSSHASSSSTNLTTLKKKFDIESSLEEIIQTSDELVKQIGDLCLKAEVVGRPITEIVPSGRETSSILLDESRIYGRENDKNKIVELLLSHEPNVGDQVGVLPIVGMGGLGKTTLAQLVYNDKKIESHFDLKAWVCVSKEVEVEKITKYIIESVTKKACDPLKLNSLQGILKDLLVEKKFLIVLDDIWNQNLDNWETLQGPFRSGKEGSKILVTTRSENVSKIMGTTPTYSLGVLKNDDCWELFKQRARVDDRDLSANPNLKAIGMAIMKKCNGLPLAAKALGGILRFKVDEEEWKYIMETDMLNIREGENNVLPILRLSYQHLPSHLKQCFAYCSIFPKDHEFDKEDLVWMWMAEGFVHSLEGKQMEDVGTSYFHDLFSRSFFHYKRHITDDKPVFVMHDLVHDLARSVSRETCITLHGDKLCNVSDKARYSSLVYERNQAVKFDVFYDAKRLRTFRLEFPFRVLGAVIQKWPHDLFPAWRCLRVLFLRNLCIKELPDSIGNLILLRYLDLYCTRIQTLPESVCNLYNLQTLIFELHRLKKMPRGIGTLTNLQTLSNFVVGESDGAARLGELKDLIHLRRRLWISQLQNVVDAMVAKEANLENKQHLSELVLEWSSHKGNIDSGDKKFTAEEIIECLQPHKNLKELHVFNYPGILFPSWIANLSGLVKLDLDGCNGIQVLPPLVQLPILKNRNTTALKEIRIQNCKNLESLPVGLQNLTSLEKLRVLRCHRLMTFPEGGLPINLRELEINGCGEFLDSFPKCVGLHKLTSLKKLTISLCSGLVSFPKEEDGDEWQLPPTLGELSFDKFKSLEFFRPKWLYNLTSLDSLEIRHAPKLSSLPEEGPPTSLKNLRFECLESIESLPSKWLHNLTSLQALSIIDVPKLASLPEEKLPTTLKYLRIGGCPILKGSCLKEKGRDWPKIAHIPDIEIDWIKI